MLKIMIHVFIYMINILSIPNVETNWVVDYGDIITIEAEADGDVYWMDENLNIINNGLFYQTNPLTENATYYVYQEQESKS